jgi:hypothetical protein
MQAPATTATAAVALQSGKNAGATRAFETSSTSLQLPPELPFKNVALFYYTQRLVKAPLSPIRLPVFNKIQRQNQSRLIRTAAAVANGVSVIARTEMAASK